MDLLILLTYDLIFMINNIVLPYLVMTEPFFWIYYNAWMVNFGVLFICLCDC